MAEGNNDSNWAAPPREQRADAEKSARGHRRVYGGWNSNKETTATLSFHANGTVSGGVTAGYTLSGDAAGNEISSRAVRP